MADVEKAQLTHPLVRSHDTRDNRPDAHALNLHYVRVGVDLKSAPLPMESQPKLQQVTRGADGGEIPLGISGIYRGYDDGFFYAANEGTAESAEVQALRRKLAAEKATARGDAAPMVANDNDPEIDEAVARSYRRKGKNEELAEQAPASQKSNSEILILNPVSWGSSSFGHAAININGTVYSWSPGGMTVEPAEAYIKIRNGFRDTIAFPVKIDDQEAHILESYLMSYGDHHTHDALVSNCTDPIESGLEELGYPIGMALTPMGLKDLLI